ncbi:hypothetical protein EBR43_03780 [bacterium]|nr:hypothetical protein [bacterium]
MMTSYYKSVSMVLVLLMGCSNNTKSSYQDPAKDDGVTIHQENKPQTLAAQRISLPSITELLTKRHHKIDPVITKDFILSFENDALVVTDIHTSTVYKKLNDFKVLVAPVMSDNKIILSTSQKGLVVLSWPNLEMMYEKKLEAPLLTSPLVLENGDIFIQYIHNIAELITPELNLYWRVTLQNFSQYYQESAYSPCADEHAIYLSFPGNGIVSLDRKNGMMRWNYRGFVEIAGLTHNGLGQKQVFHPLNVLSDTLVSKISDGTIHLLDKDTGMVKTVLEATAETPILIDKQHLYYVDSENAMICYHLDERKQMWRNTSIDMPISSLQHMDANRIIANAVLPHLYLIDAQEGMLLQHFVHQFHQARLLSSQDNDTIYGIDKFGIFFKLNSEKFS